MILTSGLSVRFRKSRTWIAGTTMFAASSHFGNLEVFLSDSSGACNSSTLCMFLPEGPGSSGFDMPSDSQRYSLWIINLCKEFSERVQRWNGLGAAVEETYSVGYTVSSDTRAGQRTR